MSYSGDMEGCHACPRTTNNERRTTTEHEDRARILLLSYWKGYLRSSLQLKKMIMKSRSWRSLEMIHCPVSLPPSKTRLGVGRKTMFLSNWRCTWTFWATALVETRAWWRPNPRRQANPAGFPTVSTLTPTPTHPMQSYRRMKISLKAFLNTLVLTHWKMPKKGRKLQRKLRGKAVSLAPVSLVTQLS